MKRIPQLIIIFIVIFTIQLFAQTKLTLKQAVNLALDKNPQITAAKKDIDVAKSMQHQARSMYLPHLYFDETFTNGNNPVYVFGTLLTQQAFTAANFDINKLNHPDAVNNFKSDVTLFQPIWEGGKIRAQNKIAKLNKNIKEKQLELTRQRLIFQVVSHYFAIQLSKQNLETAESALKSARSSMNRIQNMYDNGLIVKSDLLRMKVYLADVKRKLLDAKNKLQLSKEALRVDLGMELPPSFDTVTPLKKYDFSLPSEQDFVKLALENRPEILSLKAAVQIANNQIKHARGNFLPSLGFFSSLEYNKGTDPNTSGGNYIIGVQMRINIFDGLYKHAKLAETHANRAKYEAQLKNLTNMVSLQVKDAYLKMRTALQKYMVAHDAVDQARESLRIMKTRYESGLATLTDLLSNETYLVGARTNLSIALYQYNLSYANLELATGQLNLNSRLFR